MIIAVSDVHLGYNKCDCETFTSFLNKCTESNIDHLVLLGDIFDFWRRSIATIVNDGRYAEIFNGLGNLAIKNIHYVVGNHDYYMLKLYERYQKDYDKELQEKGDVTTKSPFPFKVSRSLRLFDHWNTFYFIHGYQLDVLANMEPLGMDYYEELSERMCLTDDIIGGFLSYMYDLIQHPRLHVRLKELQRAPHERSHSYINNIHTFAKSRGAYILIGMKPDEKLIFGHTHESFMYPEPTRECPNPEIMIANTGSWIDEKQNARQKIYLKIDNGQMELKRFDEKNFP